MKTPLYRIPNTLKFANPIKLQDKKVSPILQSRYELGIEMGVGATGFAMSAVQKESGQPVVIKFILKVCFFCMDIHILGTYSHFKLEKRQTNGYCTH